MDQKSRIRMGSSLKFALAVQKDRLLCQFTSYTTSSDVTAFSSPLREHATAIGRGIEAVWSASWRAISDHNWPAPWLELSKRLSRVVPGKKWCPRNSAHKSANVVILNGRTKVMKQNFKQNIAMKHLHSGLTLCSYGTENVGVEARLFTGGALRIEQVDIQQQWFQ